MSAEVVHDGYRRVTLYTNGVRARVSVHRLVARVFVPGSGPQVDHDDGDKSNNAAANLLWMAQSPNIQKDFIRGTRGGAAWGVEEENTGWCQGGRVGAHGLRGIRSRHFASPRGLAGMAEKTQARLAVSPVNGELRTTQERWVRRRNAALRSALGTGSSGGQSLSAARRSAR